jgi:hypothetical protein
VTTHWAAALLALYGLGVAGFTREVSHHIHDTTTSLGRAAKDSLVLACLTGAVIVGLWFLVLPTAALLRRHS